MDLLPMPESKLDFLAYVLETARKGTTRELIASENDICHGLVENSLNLLKDLDLLAERHNSPVSFVTTEKGLQFLQDYSRLTKQLGSGSHLKWQWFRSMPSRLQCKLQFSQTLIYIIVA